MSTSRNLGSEEKRLGSHEEQGKGDAREAQAQPQGPGDAGAV